VRGDSRKKEKVSKLRGKDRTRNIKEAIDKQTTEEVKIGREGLTFSSHRISRNAGGGGGGL